MSALKFNHVFCSLLGLCILTAFVINPKYTDRVRNVQGLFAPVALPTRALASRLHARFARDDDESDRRAAAELREENTRLRAALFNVTGRLDEINRINADRGAVGKVRELCTPVRVIGTDGGSGEGLALPALESLAAGMPVLYGAGLAGRIQRGGAAGAQVQLVTDRGFRATARFVCLVKQPDGSFHAVSRHASPALAQGGGRDPATGKGCILVTSFPLNDAQQVQEGDELVLDDPDWPPSVQWRSLGRVVGKSPRRDAPLFAEIRVQPARNLKELREVMVLTK
jgi:hypothetical protein